MASFTQRGGRIRAFVRKGGHTRCATFGSRAAAKAWATRIEGEVAAHLRRNASAGAYCSGAESLRTSLSSTVSACENR
jgi:hypothetical protein